MNILIKNGNIVLENSVIKGDLLIKEHMISEIRENLSSISDSLASDPSTIIIDATDLIVLPGGIDAHTHFNIDVGVKSVDDFYSGTVAAACGGTTTIIDHMGFGPKGCNQYHQLEKYHGYAKGNAVIDYSFHGVIQHLDDEIFDQIKDLAENRGITSFKLYMTYNYKMSDENILEFFKKTKELCITVCIHAEIDEEITFLREKFISENKLSPICHAKSRPDYTESEAIEKLIKLAKQAENPNLYIVHISSKNSIDIIKKYQNIINIYTETCPQYLLLDESKYLENSNNEALKYILSPPLRTKESNEKLWKAIQEGFIDTVATDHCTFNFMGDKQLGKDDFTKCPNGIPGVETRIPLLFSEGVMKNKISLLKFADVISTNPAKIFGLYPQKGVIKENSDADLVIIDPNINYTIKHENLHANVDYTCYEGFELTGKIKYTISKGNIIVKDNKFLGKKGDGNFIKRTVRK